MLAGKYQYDLCNAHFIFPTGPISYALRRLRELPYVLTARGSDVPGHNPNRFRLDHQLLRPVWRGLVRDADAVVAVSRHLAGRIEEARIALAELAKRDPAMTVGRFRRVARESSAHPLWLATHDRQAEALRSLGMPEE